MVVKFSIIRNQTSADVDLIPRSQSLLHLLPNQYNWFGLIMLSQLRNLVVLCFWSSRCVQVAFLVIFGSLHIHWFYWIIKKIIWLLCHHFTTVIGRYSHSYFFAHYISIISLLFFAVNYYLLFGFQIQYIILVVRFLYVYKECGAQKPHHNQLKMNSFVSKNDYFFGHFDFSFLVACHWFSIEQKFIS